MPVGRSTAVRDESTRIGRLCARLKYGRFASTASPAGFVTPRHGETENAASGDAQSLRCVPCVVQGAQSVLRHKS